MRPFSRRALLSSTASLLAAAAAPALAQTPAQAQPAAPRFGYEDVVKRARELATTPYGPNFWNQECAEEQGSVTITAVIRNAQTNSPSIEFSPAMRFSPDRNVQLYLKVDNAATLSSMAKVLYCGPFSTLCTDESVSDSSLRTTIDAANNTVFRRIKHFSGYTVAE